MPTRRTPKQLEFVIRTHGGRRDGAGRKRQSIRANAPIVHASRT